MEYIKSCKNGRVTKKLNFLGEWYKTKEMLQGGRFCETLLVQILKVFTGNISEYVDEKGNLRDTKNLKGHELNEAFRLISNLDNNINEHEALVYLDDWETEYYYNHFEDDNEDEGCDFEANKIFWGMMSDAYDGDVELTQDIM